MAGTILQQAVGRAAARPLTACSTAQWRPAAALSSNAAPQQRLGQAAAQQRAQRRHLSAAAAAPQRSSRGLAVRPRAAMFDGLSRSLEKAWDTVRKDGKLSADNIKEPMREIRCVCHCLLASMNKPLWQCSAAVASTSMGMRLGPALCRLYQAAHAQMHLTAPLRAPLKIRICAPRSQACAAGSGCVAACGAALCEESGGGGPGGACGEGAVTRPEASEGAQPWQLILASQQAAIPIVELAATSAMSLLACWLLHRQLRKRPVWTRAQLSPAGCALDVRPWHVSPNLDPHSAFFAPFNPTQPISHHSFYPPQLTSTTAPELCRLCMRSSSR
jgi:hypothetical protein